MTKQEKDAIAMAARKLIVLCQICDDTDYVDEVIQSVCDGEIYPAIAEETE